MVRIISGRHRGRNLVTPEGRVTRPTSDRARVALFNILGTWLEGRRVLDLYAGCGSIGLECLSRGAGRVVFVERDPECVECIGGNARKIGETERVEVIGADVTETLARYDGEAFDLVFADPPYREASLEALLGAVGASRAARQDTVVIVEHEATPHVDRGTESAGWYCYRASRYSKTQFSFFSHDEPTGKAS